jgi:hypothetical protein
MNISPHLRGLFQILISKIPKIDLPLQSQNYPATGSLWKFMVHIPLSGS